MRWKESWGLRHGSPTFRPEGPPAPRLARLLQGAGLTGQMRQQRLGGRCGEKVAPGGQGQVQAGQRVGYRHFDQTIPLFELREEPVRDKGKAVILDNRG